MEENCTPDPALEWENCKLPEALDREHLSDCHTTAILKGGGSAKPQPGEWERHKISPWDTAA
jgi:hypothetical protein